MRHAHGIRSRRSRSGLTLIELMINLAIVSIIFMAVSTAMTAMLGSFRGNETLLRSRQSATVMLDYMLAGIRQAKSVDLGLPLTASQLSSGNLTLLEYRDYSGAGKDRWRSFTYDPRAGVLKLSINGGPAQTVLTNIVSMQFRSRPETDALTNELTLRSVTVEMVLSTRDMAGKEALMTFSGTAYARSIPLS